MSARKVATLLSVTSALVLGLSACGSDPAPAPSDSKAPDATAEASATTEASEAESAAAETASTAAEPAPASERDVALGPGSEWDIPFDTFMEADALVREKAYEVALKKCVKDAGLTVTVPEVVYTEENAKALRTHLKALQFLTPEYAAVLGYHMPVAKGINAEFRDFMIDGQKEGSPEEQQKFKDCLVTLKDKNEALTGTNMGEFMSSNEAAFDEITEEEKKVKEDPEWKEAVGKWTACMEAGGYPDVSGDPLDMPLPSKMIEWFDFDSGPSMGKPVEAEIATAKQDAQCRVESGFDKIALQKLTDFYTKQLTDRKDIYTAFKEAMDKDNEAMHAFIKENQ